MKEGDCLEGLINDELQIYRGKDFYVKDGIHMHQPTLDEICEYGEQEYFNMIHVLTAVGADMKWQLDEIGINYCTISDFVLFYKMLCQGYTKNQTAIIFGDLDFSKFKIYKRCDNDEPIMYDSDHDISIDEYTYLLIADILRKFHGYKRNNQVPGNESTRRILIEDAKDEYLINKDKEYHSPLKNLVSSLINSSGFKYSHSEVWAMKINAFMDSVKRITKIKNADLLLQSGYSGYGINLDKIDKKNLDWQGELE